MFKRLERKQIHKDEWQTLYLDTIEFPNKTQGTYVAVDRKPGVGVVVTTKSHKVLLQKEYRYVVDLEDWEIPGGGIDEGESPETAAMRELYEETGIKVENVERLGQFYPLHSLNNETVTLFHVVVADDVEIQDNSEDTESFGERKFFSFDEALQMIDDEVIVDVMTAHALQMAIRKITKQI